MIKVKSFFLSVVSFSMLASSSYASLSNCELNVQRVGSQEGFISPTVSIDADKISVIGKDSVGVCPMSVMKKGTDVSGQIYNLTAINQNDGKVSCTFTSSGDLIRGAMRAYSLTCDGS